MVEILKKIAYFNTECGNFKSIKLPHYAIITRSNIRNSIQHCEKLFVLFLLADVAKLAKYI